MKRVHAYYEKRGAQIVCSLLSEGYRKIVEWQAGKHGKFVFLRHNVNGSRMKLAVTASGVYLYKNGKLIKHEA